MILFCMFAILIFDIIFNQQLKIMKKPFTMSRFLLFIVTIVVCASGYAANYFEPGTVWEYKETNMGRIYPCTVTLVDAVDADGAPCYKVVKEYIETELSGTHNYIEPKPISNQLVKIDGEKVYICFANRDDSQWLLIYDFSLQPGEGCLIKETKRYWWDYGSGPELQPQKEVYFKFIGMTKHKNYDVEVMEMKVFWSEEESGDDSNAICTHYWIPGVGSDFTFDGDYMYLYPDQWGQSSFYSWLMKVTDAKGDVVVEYHKYSEPAWDEVENAFVDGTVWEMISYPDMPDVEIGHFQYKLDGVREIGGYEAMQMYMLWPGKDPKFVAYVRTDGDKVYWAADEENPEWYLCYDFGMKSGDECDFYDMGSSDPSNNPITMRCAIKIPFPKYDRYPTFLMQRIGDGTYQYKTEYWLKGIGSTWGPTFSSIADIDGIGFEIQRVTNGDRVIFEMPGSGITAPTVEQTSGTVSYYNLQGVRVNNPSGGVFIRVADGKTSKVLLK